MLFRAETKRYLWLKLGLSTFDPDAELKLRSLEVVYPRLSYLRYLPATYQDNKTSREFLERFLSLFEAIFEDLDTKISQIHHVFDPDLVKPESLSWLASWLDVALQDDWSVEIKRELIRRADELYRAKGTPRGIASFIEIVTGHRPILLEHGRAGRPLVLGGRALLGVDSLLAETPMRGFRLGDDAILGGAALRAVVQTPDDPFLGRAYRFTLLLNLTPEQFERHAEFLRRILRDSIPAHTSSAIRLIAGAGIDAGSYLGLNSRVDDYRPFQIGVHSKIGHAVAAISREEGAPLGRNSNLAGGIALF